MLRCFMGFMLVHMRYERLVFQRRLELTYLLLASCEVLSDRDCCWVNFFDSPLFAVSDKAAWSEPTEQGGHEGNSVSPSVTRIRAVRHIWIADGTR
ncbi:uncharacterized protein EI97DRAFT_258244 [Westerdykella ornata]|uniref:Uncharacterized protein n=1 Tax=Westerdykella ornata TaxID=318751 RepID=A0A6A6J6B1_WESOR|nr:uncharacterized protein EI97DRAFT_258244 [Westerdykella ornata]KAF2271737.1 hypothetical protein EI97DRAFT_258244 [Westerdykella ornata]